MRVSVPDLITGCLFGITICSSIALTSTTIYADNNSAIDNISITVPVSCTMTSTIDTGQEHAAVLASGTYSGAPGSAYENGIGKTTLTTFCNDYNGFSIYAIGFTGDTEGDNTLVGTSASGDATINTKVYESTDTTSNWSMKVSKIDDSTQAFNPVNMSITNDFNTWHTVPDDYTKVAEYKATVGSSATDQSLGAKLETTYAAYISKTQPADVYTGQVKYVLVHPHNHAKPVIADKINVTYNGNGLTFPNGTTTNQVTYAAIPFYYYIANTPQAYSSSNVTDAENYTPYTTDQIDLVPVSAPGASKMKVVLHYGMTANTARLIVAEGSWEGWDEGYPHGVYYEFYSYNDNLSGTETYIFDGDTATLYFESWYTPTAGYDYGFFAEVYPIYDTEQDDTTMICDYIANTPQAYSSSNVTDAENYTPYVTDQEDIVPVSAPGASRMKVVLHYGMTADTAALSICEDNPPGTCYDLDSDTDNLSGAETYILNGDAATLYFGSWGTPIADYDYGFFAEVYPIYDTEQDDTTLMPPDNVRVEVESGTYAVPGGFANWSSNEGSFPSESEVIEYISQNPKSLSQTGLTLNASNVGYVASDTTMQIGQPVPEGVKLWATPEEAISSPQFEWFDYGNYTYLKHVLNNDNTIAESYAGIVINDSLKATICHNEAACMNLVNGNYELRGGVDESSEATTPIYDANVDTIKSAFNYDLQPNVCRLNSEARSCNTNFSASYDLVYAGIGSDYEVRFTYNRRNGFIHSSCSVEVDGSSACQWIPK